jgi:hypothetical protein
MRPREEIRAKLKETARCLLEMRDRLAWCCGFERGPLEPLEAWARRATA